MVDIAQGLQIWSNLQVYREYLRRFSTGYGQAVAEMHASLAADDRPAAAALAHKLAGVAANMALPATQRLASEAERVLSMGYDPIPVLARLDEAIRQAMAVIARFAPTVVLADRADPLAASAQRDTPAARTAIAAHLQDLLAALDTDNPAPVEALLALLAQHVLAQDLVAARACVSGFDFRGAEACSRQLAHRYGITLKE